MEFGIIQIVEFETRELLEAFKLRNGMAGIFMDINEFCRKVGEVGKEVTELFDGINAFAAAVIGHKDMLDGRGVLRDDKNGAFSVV